MKPNDLTLAVEHHRAGRLQEAERIYKKLLRAHPKHADALHLLGAIDLQKGNYKAALRLIRKSLGVRPDSAEAHYNLGNVQYALGDWAAAVAAFRKVVELQPTNLAAYNNLGNALVAQGALDGAIAAYRKIVALKPDFAPAHNNLGIALTGSGELEAAVASFRCALELQPDDGQIHNNLGIALKAQRKLDDAATAFREATAHEPNFAEAHNNLGAVLAEQGDAEAAMAAFHEALAARPDDAKAHRNLGNLLQEEGKLEQAEAFLRKALELRPDDPEAHYNLGNTLYAQCRPREAIEEFRAALALDPDYADAQWNLALTLLLVGDYAGGWPAYEWRWRATEIREPAFAVPRWDGGPLEGRTILLHAEQGLGDTIQFVRYAPLVAARGGNVVVQCDALLVRLLETCDGVDKVIARDDAPPSLDMHAPLMSLPGLLELGADSIPAEVPYLAPPATNGAKIEAALASVGGRRKIGVVWSGNPSHKNDRNRSCDAASFSALAAREDVALISLQKGAGADAIAALPEIVDMGPLLHDFADTAGALARLDLLISVDTAVAHLAGALGRPVWLLLPFAPDWRWMLARADSPWYPTMRVFRQPRPGDWPGVFEQVVEALGGERR